MFERTVNCLEATSTFGNVSVEICRDPVDGADNLVRIKDNSFDNSKMMDANTGLALTLHSFDSNSVSWLHFGRPLWLFPVLPTKHPHALFDETLILMVNATPRCSYDPVLCHVTVAPER